MRQMLRLLSTMALVLGLAAPAFADPFLFTTGNTDGLMGVAARPSSADGSKIETEAADDFILSTETLLYGAVFTALVPPGTTLDDIGQVTVEIYRVFPNDSDPTRTPNVPTRVNSPADAEFADRSNNKAAGQGNLAFTFVVLNTDYQVGNSVINGIKPLPNQTTGGDGPVSGWLAQFTMLFVDEFDLPADHYFIVPQVEILNGKGEFLWLSAPRNPPPFAGDLQQWIRNDPLQPDWLRVGTDIVGGTTFNGSFSLIGETMVAQ
jgi:hypothetical protein